MIKKPVLSRLYLLPATMLLTLMSLSTTDPVIAGEPAPPAGGAVILSGSPEGIRIKTTGEFPPGHAAEERLFEIGSITKVFTGLLLAQSVVEEVVDLETIVADVLPGDFSFADPEVGRITLGELATHTSGLPRLPDNFPPSTDPANPYAAYYEEDLLEYLASAQLAEKQGEGEQIARYSNLGYGLLGYLLGIVHGKPYPALLRERILEPLEMHHTFVRVPEELSPRKAVPHSGGETVPEWEFDVLAGAGALWSTGADLARFAECLLHPGPSGMADAVALLKEPRSTLSAASVGLGLMRETIYGKERLYHDGGTGGFSSSMILTPVTGQFLIVLANQADGYATLIANRQLAEKLPGKEELPVSGDKAGPSGESLLPEAYAGRYSMGADAVLLVQAIEGRLYARLTGQLALPLEPVSGHHFAYTDVEASLHFNLNESGEVDRLSLHQSGRVLPASRTGPAPEVPLLLPAAKAEEYAGKYQLGPGQVFDISAVNRQLVVQLTGQPALPVIPSGEDRFDYDVVEATLVFTRDPDGTITGLVLHQNGMQLPASRL
jgi:CubicO group peptidase (beta-lactamase class C family)